MELRIATVRPLPEPDPDEDPLLSALAQRGVRARMVAWRDPSEDWERPVPTLLRSTWDYLHASAEFLTWCALVERHAPLWNPSSIVRWNVHKFYLRELEAAGLPIVPTAFLERGSRVELAGVLQAHGWDDAVVKPAVSAASFGTLRVRRGVRAELTRGEEHLAVLLAERDMLVQRYAAAVETSGERALVWIDGALTHAVRKSPRFSGEEERVSAALSIAPDERALAERLLARFPGELLYARIDLVRDAHGVPAVMELELIEPSLFLVQHPPALARLADGLAARLA